MLNRDKPPHSGAGKQLKIFILGAYRSIDGSTKDFDRLSMLERWLVNLGCDAFLAANRNRIDSIDLQKLSPREKTLRIVQHADLNLFVFTRTRIRNGLVAELTELQTRFPQLSWKHVILLEKDLTLSWIIDESKGGLLSITPVKQITFEDERELREVAQQVAFNYASAKKMGRTP